MRATAIALVAAACLLGAAACVDNSGRPVPPYPTSTPDVGAPPTPVSTPGSENTPRDPVKP